LNEDPDDELVVVLVVVAEAWEAGLIAALEVVTASYVEPKAEPVVAAAD
jgi:hypothetical protein